jgi:hypothetical protein
MASLYIGSHSLSTGVPRYQYQGKYFFFTRSGRRDTNETKFELRVEWLADAHMEGFVITTGPYYYLPNIENDKVQTSSCHHLQIKK